MSLNALYVDFNSYFASVEQLLRPELRGRPVAVLPVVATTTCCIAASYEAKAFGIKTGTRVSEALRLCPELQLIEARAERYVEYHHRLVAVVESCSHVERTFSIDEMVCKLTGSQRSRENALALAQRIKQSIARQIGPEIRCSIGIAPNTFLAKVASDMQKPDGCVVIEAHEIPDKLFSLALRDLNGIGRQMEMRLARQGIRTVRALYGMNRQQLHAAWGSIDGALFYDKLRGVEPPPLPHDKKSLGHSRVLPPNLRNRQSAVSVLHQLLQKACLRLRSNSLLTSRVRLTVKFSNHPDWQTERSCAATDDTLLLTRALDRLCAQFPDGEQLKPHSVAITFLQLDRPGIPDLFQPSIAAERQKLNGAIDQLNMRYGKNTVYFGGAHGAVHYAPLRIAFNHIPDLENESDKTDPP